MKVPVSPCVVDTNVPITANQAQSQACRLSCIEALEEIIESGHLVIDDKFRILKEYMNKLSPKGQPGVGDAFLKWVLTNQVNPDRCTSVRITPRPADPRDFEEFPTDVELSEFDPSDRKFVAVSCVHPVRPPILQAADSKWWGLNAAFKRCGVTVHFLCPEDIEAVHARKQKSKKKK